MQQKCSSDLKRRLHEESHQTKSPSSLTACSRQRSVINVKGRTRQKQGMQITTHHQLYLLRNAEIRETQIILPALRQSQPDALLSITSTPPPTMCHTWSNLHSRDSSTIFQPPSNHTSGQKSQSNDNNCWILRQVFRPFCSATTSEIADLLEMKVLCKACAEWENNSIGLLVFEEPY